MTDSVDVMTVHPRSLAVVRREVAPGEVGSAWGPAVGKVWDYIRSQPGLWTDGHNIFLYHHPNQPDAPILCEFGVEVTRIFEPAGEVYATETPGGEAAVTVHRGPYDRMHEAYKAIDQWMEANRRELPGTRGKSMETRRRIRFIPRRRSCTFRSRRRWAESSAVERATRITVGGGSARVPT